MEQSASNIYVFCRFRPLNDREQKEANGTDVPFSFIDRNVVRTELPKQNYVFDEVFQPHISQETIYKKRVEPLLDQLLQGYNSTLIAYGQTGSGKTFTMEGDISDSEKMGLIPRIIMALDRQTKVESRNITFRVFVSMYQIYNNEIDDLLLLTQTNLRIREIQGSGAYVEGLSEVKVKEVTDALQILREGSSNRVVASTSMNKTSSRSHSVFIMRVEQQNELDGKLLKSVLTLVDLAGSERVSKTSAVGQRLDEAKNINKTLAALGNVINSLTDGSGTHIPYRDSKLTFLLKNSLGGNSKTALILACSPSKFNFDETVSTLRFGVRAKLIKNNAVMNVIPSALELERLLHSARAEIDRLTRALSLKDGRGEGDSSEGKLEEMQLQILQLQTDLQETQVKLSETSSQLMSMTLDLKQTKKEYGDCLDELTLLKSGDILKERARYQAENQVLESRLANASKEMSRLQNKNSELLDIESKYQQLLAKYTELEKQNAQLKRDKTGLDSEISSLRDQLSELGGVQARSNQLSKELESSNTEKRSIQKELQQLKRDFNALKQSSSAEADGLQKEIIELKAQNGESESQISMLKNDIMKREKTQQFEKDQNVASLKELNETITQLKASLVESSKQLKASQASATTLRETVHNLEMEKNALSNTKQSIQAEFDSSQTEYQKLESSLRIVEKRNQSLQEENETHQSRVTELESSVDSLQLALDESQMHQKDLESRLFQVAADNIELKSNYNSLLDAKSALDRDYSSKQSDFDRVSREKKDLESRVSVLLPEVEALKTKEQKSQETIVWLEAAKTAMEEAQKSLESEAAALRSWKTKSETQTVELEQRCSVLTQTLVGSSDKLESMSKRVQDLETAGESLRTKNVEFSTSKVVLEMELSNSQSLVDNLQKKLIETEQKLATTSNMLKSFEKNYSILESKFDQLQQDFNGLQEVKGENRSLSLDQQRMSQQKDQLQRELDSLQENYSTVCSENMGLQSKVIQSETEVKSLRLRTSKFLEEQQKQQAELSRVRSENEQLANDNINVSNDLNERERKLREIMTDYSQLKESRLGNDAALQDITERNEELRIQNKDLKTSLDSAISKNGTLKEKLNQLSDDYEKRFRSLQKQIDDLEESDLSTKEEHSRDLQSLDAKLNDLKRRWIDGQAREKQLLLQIGQLKEEALAHSNDQNTVLQEKLELELTVKQLTLKDANLEKSLQKLNETLKRTMESQHSTYEQLEAERESLRSALSEATRTHQEQQADLGRRLSEAATSLDSKESERLRLLIELSSLRDENSALQDSLRQLKQHQQAVESELEETRASLTHEKDRLESSLSDLRKTSRSTEQSLEGEILRLQASLSKDNDDVARIQEYNRVVVESLRENVDKLTSKNSSLLDSLSSVQRELQDAQKASVQSDQALESLRQNLSVRGQELAASEEERSSQATELLRQQEQVNQLRDSLADRDRQLEEATARLDSQATERRVEMERQTNQMKSLEGKLKSLSDLHELSSVQSQESFELERLELQRTIDRLELEKSGVEKKLSGLQEAHSSLQIRGEILQGRVADLEERAREVSTLNEGLSQLRQELSRAKKDQQQQQDRSRSEVTGLEAQLALQREAEMSLRQSLEASERSVGELRRQLDSRDQSLGESSRRLERSQQVVSGLESEVESFCSTLLVMDRQRDESDRFAADLRRRLRSDDALQSEASSRDETIALLRRQLADLSGVRRNLSESLSAADALRSELQSRDCTISELQARESDLLRESEDLRRDLELRNRRVESLSSELEESHRRQEDLQRRSDESGRALKSQLSESARAIDQLHSALQDAHLQSKEEVPAAPDESAELQRISQSKRELEEALQQQKERYAKACRAYESLKRELAALTAAHSRCPRAPVTASEVDHCEFLQKLSRKWRFSKALCSHQVSINIYGTDARASASGEHTFFLDNYIYDSVVEVQLRIQYMSEEGDVACFGGLMYPFRRAERTSGESFLVWSDGRMSDRGSLSSGGLTLHKGDVLQIEYDMRAGTVTFRRSGDAAAAVVLTGIVPPVVPMVLTFPRSLLALELLDVSER